MEATRLHNKVWAAINKVIFDAKSRPEVTYGKVTKVDSKRKILWAEGYGNQPIPIVGWEYEGIHRDMFTVGNTPATGNPLPAGLKGDKIIFKPMMPKVGEVVVVLRQLGVRRLPKAVGIMLSTGGMDSVNPPIKPSGKVKRVYIQGGHVPPQQPGHETETGGGGKTGTDEVRMSRPVRDKLIALLAKNPNFDPISLPSKVPDDMRGALFFSLHCDASDNPLTTGCSFGYPNATETQSLIFKAKLMEQYSDIPGHPVNSLPDNYTGGLAGYYAYSRYTGGCALLMEHGFVSNSSERDWIFSHFDEIALAHYKAICDYFNVTA